MSALELDRVSVSYGSIEAVREVSLSLRAGGIACLLGANGAGKSSLLNAMIGLVPLRSGSIVWQGQDITGMPAYKAVRHGLSLSPEGRRLFPGLSVLENLAMGAYSNRSRARFAEGLERVFTLFPRLKERARQRAGSLSGGEQQMCAIGRAMMSAPSLLLLDEPSLGLAPKVIGHVAAAIAEINRGGVTVLIVEQNAKLGLRLSDYAYVLEIGRVVLEGPSAALIEDPHVSAIYLGGGSAVGVRGIT